VRLRYSVDLDYEVGADGCDFIFNIQAAKTQRQVVIDEQLRFSQNIPVRSYQEPVHHTRYLRAHAEPGRLQIHHQATVDLHHYRSNPLQVPEVRLRELPDDVLPYLYPSRYCESDRLHRFAVGQFGLLWQGYTRVEAIRSWVQNHVQFRSNSSSGTTSACDTLLSKQGVCRDFAHLMIALCRAVNIPARFTTGIDYGADPALGPQDFHAYVEAYLGQRWYLFDPSGVAIPMGFIRLATGRDAADAAFASIFGSVQTSSPVLNIEAMAGPNGLVIEPVHGNEALSTDDAGAGNANAPAGA